MRGVVMTYDLNLKSRQLSEWIKSEGHRSTSFLGESQGLCHVILRLEYIFFRKICTLSYG